ncbi:hypothetical protein SynA1560_01333 [Synechococcus sp. A15-60]|nr:hypothetical protein SynA1560_01333 [Synechococcus sp. A15-60]
MINAEALVPEDGSNICESKLSINNHLTILHIRITKRAHA